MAALAALKEANCAQFAPIACVPASVEAMVAILDYYGFDHFFSRTLRKIDLRDAQYAAAVDTAIDNYYSSDDRNSFNLRRAFRVIVEDLMNDEGITYVEALELLAEEDYVVPVDVAQTYSVDAGETDIERLSTLIRNRARRLLPQG